MWRFLEKFKFERMPGLTWKLSKSSHYFAPLECWRLSPGQFLPELLQHREVEPVHVQQAVRQDVPLPGLQLYQAPYPGYILLLQSHWSFFKSYWSGMSFSKFIKMYDNTLDQIIVKLTSVNISWCDLITQSGIAALSQGCRKLKSFILKVKFRDNQTTYLILPPGMSSYWRRGLVQPREVLFAAGGHQRPGL